MSNDKKPSAPHVLIAGDICIEVIGVPMPAPSESHPQDNWRLTGEVRTYHRRGGALLLTIWLPPQLKPNAPTTPC